jgi:hypothetical protein
MQKDYFCKPILHILLIIVFAFLAYAQTLSVPFHFDDGPNIEENTYIRDLGNFGWPLGSDRVSENPALKTRYIGYLTFALNYAVHGLDVRGYHVINIIIHILNGLLVYWFVLLIFQTPHFSGTPKGKDQGKRGEVFIMALFAALLFSVHPVQTQAVTYIVQRFASLATLFYLLSVVLYANARIVLTTQGRAKRKTKAFIWYILCLLSAVFAMKTKEMAFTLPFVIITYEIVFFTGAWRKRIAYLIPVFLTALIVPIGLVGVGKPIGEIIGDVSEVTRLQTALSRWDYLFTEMRVVVTYIRLLFVPVHQNLDYDYPVYHSFFDTAVLLSCIVLVSIVCLVLYIFYRYRDIEQRTRILVLGLMWFFITLSVESSIIPIKDVIFEHRVYLEQRLKETWYGLMG